MYSTCQIQYIQYVGALIVHMDTTCVIDCSFALSIISHFLSHLRYIFHCLQDKVVQKWPTDETVRTRAVR